MPTVSTYIWFIFHLESVTWQLGQTRSCFFQCSVTSMIYFFSNNLRDPGEQMRCSWALLEMRLFKKQVRQVSDLLLLRKCIWFFSPHTPKASPFSFLRKNGKLCFSLANFHVISSFFLCSVINAIHIIVIYTQCKT